MGFIKFEKLLSETHRVEDKFDYSFAVKKLHNLIAQAPNFSIICVVGPYGSGKSTALHQLRPRTADKIWFEFDAWKYPERKDLWENFVLELARQFDERTFNRVEKNIDGRQNDDKKTLLKAASQGLNMLMPGAAVIGTLEHFLQTSPATRTYQLQKILTSLIEEKLQSKEATIILEDIDRSGEAGIFFLETLKAYLSSLEGRDIAIKCVVPVAEDKFDASIDSYLKCTDITEYFRTPVPVLDGYVYDLLEGNILDEMAKLQVIQFCKMLFLHFRDQMSPRKLKYILRTANSKYESMEADGLKPDARVAIAIEASRLLYDDSAGAHTKYFQEFVAARRIRGEPFARLMAAIAHSERLDRIDASEVLSFAFDERTNLPMNGRRSCQPWFGRQIGTGRDQASIHSFYFDY